MDLPPLLSQYGDVASHIPGRLRMRFPQRHRRTHHMAQLKQGLERRQGITDVAVNQAAGSVTSSTGIFVLDECRWQRAPH